MTQPILDANLLETWVLNECGRSFDGSLRTYRLGKWVIFWRGWISSPLQTRLVGQWLGWPLNFCDPPSGFTREAGPFFYASHPGGGGVYHLGEEFDIGLKPGQILVTSETMLDPAAWKGIQAAENDALARIVAAISSWEAEREKRT